MLDILYKIKMMMLDILYRIAEMMTEFGQIVNDSIGMLCCCCHFLYSSLAFIFLVKMWAAPIFC